MPRTLVIGVVVLATAGTFVVMSAAATSGIRSVGEFIETFRSIDDRPVSADATPVTFTVRPGSTATDVAEDLRRVGLIRSTTAFRLQVQLRHVGSRLSVGEYELRRNMGVNEILDILTAGPELRDSLVTIPEGWRAEEIAQYLDSRGVVDASAFLDAVAGRDESTTIPMPSDASTFEGYLFPETYDFGRNRTPNDVLNTFVGQFGRTVDDDLVEQAAARGLSVHQLITLASIIEREATEPEERPEIAAVFENRMARGMPLQADPTVQYAQIPFGLLSRNGFWKAPLVESDLQIDSPYNTYRVRGLPPGPICNPGLASIKAAAEPANDPWLYFVAKGDGSHLFASTYDEHLRNQARVKVGGGPR